MEVVGVNDIGLEAFDLIGDLVWPETSAQQSPGGIQAPSLFAIAL
jgi:hypothetical protein